MVFSKLDMPATKHKILKSTFFKQVKQELAKELYSILVGSEGSETQRRRSRIDSDDSENESMSSRQILSARWNSTTPTSSSR